MPDYRKKHKLIKHNHFLISKNFDLFYDIEYRIWGVLTKFSKNKRIVMHKTTNLIFKWKILSLIR